MKEKNTTDVISSLIESVYDAFDDKKHTVDVFLDLKKTFNSINHSILLLKLKNYVMRGVACSWFSSFFRNQKQCVKVIQELSDCEIINSGFPQGTTIAPLLFIPYINMGVPEVGVRGS